jgi:hypothetical protein
MKNSFLLLMASLALSASSGMANVIAVWTFENNYLTNSFTGTNSPPLAPDTGPAGSEMWGHHADDSSLYKDISGNGSTHALDANHWNVGDYFEFQTSTLDFTNISISFDQYRSGTAPADWDFEFSDDGSFFTTVSTYSIANSSSWITFSPDLSFETALADDANVYFRLVADSDAGSSGGTSRVDNFTVLGTFMPVPEPSAATFAALCGAAGIFALRRKRA